MQAVLVARLATELDMAQLHMKEAQKIADQLKESDR
jgi:hypothetical protein